MRIEIRNTSTIEEIRKRFQNKFPFLSLEFFSGEQKNGTLNPLCRILDGSKKLGSLQNSLHEGELLFTGDDTVSNVENAFREKFGLNVQVFRKSGMQWLVTTTTDGFTLDQQNDLGKEMSVSVERPVPEDIHEQQ